MAKVVVTAQLPGRWAELLAGHTIVAPGPEVILPRARVLDELADAEALLPLLSLRIDEPLLLRAPRLRIVANYAVGYDNVDVTAATRRGVLLTHTPGVLTEATADLTLALLLACARRVVEADRFARSGAWKGWQPEQLLGLDLDGAQLGLVGLGRIGQAVARRARAFGMRIAYASPRPAAAEVERALGAVHRPLDALLAGSDVVSLHCPLTDETRHLLDARALALLRPGAILINTARGALVDEAALAEAVAAGRLVAGLDVFEEEPQIAPRLVDSPSTVLLPHIGSAARGARARMAELAAQSIADFLEGRRPAHPVNPEVLVDRHGAR
jgi:glyoxylate reductase